MYSSIASLHIALDGRLQVLNSNRKQSIHPEQYDMAINDAILTVLKQRFSPQLNSKQQGLEESIKRYTDLSNLKKEVNVDILIDGVDQFFYKPSDCYLPITLNAELLFNRNPLIIYSDNIEMYVIVIKINEDTINDNEIEIEWLNGDSIRIPLNGITKSNKSKFYTLNYLKEYFKETYDLDTYIESFDNYNFPDSILIVTSNGNYQIYAGMGAEFSAHVFDRRFLDITEYTTSIIKGKKVDLVSTSDYNNMNNDYYLSKNLHLNPVYKITKDRYKLKRNDNFLYKSAELEYIKYPRLVNSKLDRMTDFTITDEILDVATTNLSGILKDETYTINKNKEQFNN